MSIRTNAPIPIPLADETADENAPATPKILSVDNIDQEHEAWCYAACAQMVIRFFNLAATQCAIAKVINNGTDCCGSAANVAACNRSGCKPEEVIPIFDRFGVKADAAFKHAPDSVPIGTDPTLRRAPDFATIKNEINNDRPVEAGLRWTGQEFRGHLVIIQGFQGNSFYWILDPLKEGGHGGLVHESYLKSAFRGGSWEFTWTGLARK